MRGGCVLWTSRVRGVAGGCGKCLFLVSNFSNFVRTDLSVSLIYHVTQSVINDWHLGAPPNYFAEDNIVVMLRGGGEG